MDNRQDLRRLRLRLRLSQLQLAELLGCRPNTMYRWESGSITLPTHPLQILVLQVLEAAACVDARKAADIARACEPVPVRLARLVLLGHPGVST